MIARARFTHAHAFAEMKFSFGNSAFRRASLSFEINNLTSRARRGLRATSSLLDLRAVASAAARFFHFAPLQGGILAMAGPCFVCKDPVAPFGFGWPGFEREKPKGKRGYLWTCSDHRPDGERRREDGIAAYYGRLKPETEITLTTNEKQKGPQE